VPGLHRSWTSRPFPVYFIFLFSSISLIPVLFVTMTPVRSCSNSWLWLNFMIYQFKVIIMINVDLSRLFLDRVIVSDF
jgi:hypothetical protein